MLNFTTVKENDNYVIREHKTLFCGAGPVLSQHYVVWPKLKRKQIEISINPLVQHVLKNCSDIEEDNLLGIIDEDSIFDDRNVEDITAEPFDKEDNTTKSIGAMYGNGELTRSIPDEIIGGGDQNDVVDVLEPAKDGNNTELPEKPIGNKIKKSLLARNFNCTLDGLGTCKEIRDKSRALIGTSNSTKISLGKWFFPDSVLAGPVDENRSFVLKVQILVNIKKQNNNSSIKYTEDENSTVFIVEEECLVVVQNENKTKRSTLHTGYNKESNPKKN
ncbi:uncharacterized protein LOC130451318 [Diorhabda sublineata]|uniref:uncharacterized protein LOC130451318 n=1 Tax=Diorhabda sublineata TaxID=1163346 RepID=UPI0024E0AAA1|nr:uncharacterized protein LOC130451318 [Diorhabda sublineata]